MTEAPSRPLDRIVETERLTLRPFRPDDEPAYAAIRSKPEVARYLSGGEAAAAEGAAKAAALVPAFAAMWEGAPGYGPWAVEERAAGRLLGHLGLRKLEELGGRTELLYALDPSAQGKGYAVEGARAALDYAFGALGLPEVIALALPENARSLKVMERAGMVRRDGLVEAFGTRVVLAEIDAAGHAAQGEGGA
ncbi:MAG: GNAT family N-acetyltransferase [Pseudomonadota bacterium]